MEDGTVGDGIGGKIYAAQEVGVAGIKSLSSHATATLAAPYEPDIHTALERQAA